MHDSYFTWSTIPTWSALLIFLFPLLWRKWILFGLQLLRREKDFYFTLYHQALLDKKRLKPEQIISVTVVCVNSLICNLYFWSTR